MQSSWIKHSQTILFFGLLFLSLVPGREPKAFGENFEVLNCQPQTQRLSYYQVERIPKNVLIVPLLYRNPDFPRETDRWPESYSHILSNFYRNRFRAKVTWLHNIRSWESFYQQTGALIQSGSHFDRVIFIGHGGFDGPVLSSAILLEDLAQKDSQGIAQQVSEAQPGNERIISISFDLHKNKPFSDFVSTHWQTLLNLPDVEMRRTLKQKHQEFQAIDYACFDKFCNPQKLSLLPDYTRRDRLDSCERVCRPALYEAKNYERASEERFMLFANALRSLVNPEGLIFMGGCNAGSDTPKQYSHWDTPGIVVSSKIAGGPYQSYVQLLSYATDRLVSGPIGRSSANEIVKRIIALENNQEQRNLCTSLPTNRIQQFADF